MASYLIKKDGKTNQIIYMEYDLIGYDFTPRTKNSSYIKINHVTLVKPSLIEKTLLIKLKKTFTKLLYKVKMVLDDEDSSSSDIIEVLDELKRLAGIITNKYQKYLKKNAYFEYLSRLFYLERQLKIKQMMMSRTFAEPEIEEEKHRSR